MAQMCVKYSQTRAGQIALRYACNTVRLFSDQPLLVLFADIPDAEAKNLPFAVDADAAHKNVCDAVEPLAKEAGVEFQTRSYDEGSALPLAAGSILVDSQPQKHARCHVLHPANETFAENRRNGPVIITFSDGNTGLVAASAAFEIVQRLPADDSGAPQVIFYHTTWPDPNAPSDDPLDHMCDTAHRVMLALEHAATERGIRYKTVVEKHDDVAQGVVEMAYKTGAVLIAMDRSEQVSQGSYVDRVLEQSPVPLLVAGVDTAPVAPPAGMDALNAFLAQRRAKLDDKQTAPRKSLFKRVSENALVWSPVFVMAMVALMYVYKALSKVSVGAWINSPTITADGFHNIADFVQALMVIVVIIVARRPSNQRYPYGRKNIEWVTSLVIGILLFVAAGKFILDCVLGLVSYLPVVDAHLRTWMPMLPDVEASNLTSHNFWWVVAVTGTSMLMSLFVSRYQVVVGNRTGHPSMVADGEETRGDGLIEAVTLIGIIAEYATGWRFIEYPLGLLVAYMICGTAKELFLTGWRVILQHSIGSEIEAELTKDALKIAGVEDVSDLKTFQIGHTAVVMTTVESHARSAGIPFVKKAVENALRERILDPAGNFKGADIHVKIDKPAPLRSRTGYLLYVTAAGKAWVAPSIVEATHLAICDIERSEVVRTKVVPLAGKDVPDLIVEKRLHRLGVFDYTRAETNEVVLESLVRAVRTHEAQLLPRTRIVQATTCSLSPLGIAINDESGRSAAA